jgi:hypothetical protein
MENHGLCGRFFVWTSLAASPAAGFHLLLQAYQLCAFIRTVRLQNVPLPPHESYNFAL